MSESKLQPQVIRELLDWLTARGFRPARGAQGASVGNDALVMECSPVGVAILRNRGNWSIEIAGPNLSYRPMDIWKACVTHGEVRIEPDDVHWQCEFLKEHLQDVCRALGPESLEETRRCLDRKREERNQRVITPPPESPWFLDLSPRPGVKLHFGFHWREDAYFIEPVIYVANDSEGPFHYKAVDFGLSRNGTQAKLHFSPSSSSSGEVGAGRNETIDTKGWHWLNERPLARVGIAYVSSDPESAGFADSAEWDVSDSG